MPKRLIRSAFLGAALVVAFVCAGRPALAIPSFARAYGVSCQKCHSVVPRLNPFGEAFLDHGFQLPEVRPDRTAFPLSTKINLVQTSAPDPGLPHAVVDEVEAFLAGTAGPRTSYFVEQYLVDGGRPGLLREAWISQLLSRDAEHVPIFAQAGSFTLPVSVDPETFRETAQHYAVFDQSVGDNPFRFFDPKNGVQLRAGHLTHGTLVQLAALQAHDRQSGLPNQGVDLMQSIQHAFGPLAISAYRYAGRRPGATATDRFWRQGFGLSYTSPRWQSQTVLQTGHDSTIDATGAAAISSGGFTQLRYEVSPRFFALGRYEGTNDPTGGFVRDFVALLGYRVGHNARLTIEDVIAHDPQTRHTLNMQYLVGY